MKNKSVTKYLKEIGRNGGRSRSEKKIAASRANAAKATAARVAFYKKLREAIIPAIIIVLLSVGIAEAFTTQASYYDRASCQAEGTWQKWGGLTASGKAYDENAITCASWDYPFFSKLKITYKDKSVIAVVTDRGPNKKLYKRGRRLDLSKQAFSALAPLSQGVITVTVEVIK
jgi:rare lipoprotein A (peptidoglycan hydrolase)